MEWEKVDIGSSNCRSVSKCVGRMWRCRGQRGAGGTGEAGGTEANVKRLNELQI